MGSPDSLRLLLYRTKEACSWLNKEENLRLWVDGLIFTEHVRKPSQVSAYHYGIMDMGIRLPSLCSLTAAHYISHQIHIKVTYVIPRKNEIHLTEIKSGNVQMSRKCEHKPEERRETPGSEPLLKYGECWVKKAHRQRARL